MDIEIKRAYDAVSDKDGVRLLVDRLWPRGIKKEELKIDGWLKDIAPSTKLRLWFAHDPSKFKEFEKNYIQELESTKPLWKPKLDKYVHKKITLLYAAKDPQFNHAQCLKGFLQKVYKNL